MSFLAPLYLLGALAVSVPILFHLIRRSPRGRTVFSTLMFLGPSPPRVTRRSRLDNLLLLLLRSAALCLLAAAFARPFLREERAVVAVEAAGKRLAVLLDSSASMRRGDLWAQALAKLDAIFEGLGPLDRVALSSFDDWVRPLAGFDEVARVPLSERPAFLKLRASTVRPTWGATDLGAALVAAAEALALDEASESEETAVKRPPHIVLVTDLQRGSRLGSLASYGWPERVSVSIERTDLPGSSNAGVSLLADRSASSQSETLRVRVANEPDSARERFTLAWAEASSGDRPPDAVREVLVPQGEARVFPLERPGIDPPSERLELAGDDEAFDNVCFVAPRNREVVDVVYLGEDRADDAGGPLYYAERALAGEDRLSVRLVAREPRAPFPPPGERPPRLVLLTANPGEALRGQLRGYVEAGGTLLYVLEDASAAASLSAILGCAVAVEEAEPRDYAMLAEVDYSHPLFAPFADPRFGDFTKIRFWRHRRLLFTDRELPDVNVVARFDRGDPAILERAHGKGRLVVLASGWHPADSQLARSTKFVPLLLGLLEDPTDASWVAATFHANEPVPLPAVPRADAPRRIRKPDGTVVILEPDARIFDETDLPGIYGLLDDETSRQFAVNVDPAESRTSPLGVGELEGFGVRIGTAADTALVRGDSQDIAVEGSQKLWRWLIVATLGLLIAETWLAGRGARAARKEAATT